MNETSSTSGVIVGIVAVVAILALIYFAIDAMRKQPATPNSQPNIELNIQSSTPRTYP